jgi:hypothetical protein
MWVWRNEGIAALWSASPDDIEEFESALKEIGESYAAQFIRDSIDVCRQKEMPDGTFDEDAVTKAAREWTDSSLLYWSGIEISLAAFVRRNREDTLSILAEVESHIEVS